MSDWNFQVKADADKAIKDTNALEDGMIRVEVQATRTGASMTAAFSGGGAAAQNAKGQFLAASQGGRAIGDALASTASNASRAATEIATVGIGMHDILQVAEAYVGIHMLESLADGYTEISNKIRIVTTDQANLKGVMDATFQIAQDTRGSWDGLTSTYQRLAQVTGGLGLSQKDVLKLLSEMSMGAKISGASAREAAMSMGEFMHAFEIGALTFRDYKVQMRDTPGLMHELQVASGKTSSQFVNMVKAGQLSASMIVDLFGKAAPAIMEKFNKTIPTIADSFTMLRNAAEKFFGEAGTGSGVLHALSTAMQFVIRNFDVFGKIILTVGEVLAVHFAIKGVMMAVRALATLGAAALANPFTAILYVIIGVIAALRQFGDAMDAGVGKGIKVSNVLHVIWTDLKTLGTAIVDFMSSAWHMLTDAFSSGIDATGIKLSFANVLRFIGVVIDSAIAVFQQLREKGKEIFGALAIIIASAFVDAFNVAIKTMEKFLNFASQALYDKLQGVSDKRAKAEAAYAASVNGIDAKDTYKDAVAKLGPAPQVNPVYATARAGDSDKDTQREIDNANKLRDKQMADLAAYKEAVIKTSADMLAARLAAEHKVANLQQGLDESGHALKANGQEYKPYSFGENLSNPLAEYDREAKKLLAQSRKDMIKAAADGVATNYVEGMLARAQASDAEAPGTVSTTKGNKEAIEATKAQISAYKKLLEALREVEAASNPVVDAQMKLAKAIDVETKGAYQGAVTWQHALGVIIDTGIKTNDARFPLQKWTRDIDEHTEALKLSNAERIRANEIKAADDRLTKEGLKLSAEDLKLVHDKIGVQLNLDAAAEVHRQRQEQYLETAKRLNAAEHDYQRETAVVLQLRKDAVITTAQEVKELDRLRLAYLDASGASKTMAGGAEKGLLEIKAEVLDVGTLVGKGLTDAFHGFEDAIVKATETGKLSFSSMASAMIADITRIAIRLLEMRLLMAILPGGGGVATAIASGVSPSAAASAGGHAQGGTYRAGGSGGPDSQLVMVRMTPGESMEFRPKNNQGSGGNNIEAHFHTDRDALMKGLRHSPMGRKVVIDIIRDEREAVKSILG